MGARRRVQPSTLAKLVVLVTTLVIYCEFLHYYVVISQCGWPELRAEAAEGNVSAGDKPLHIMALADTHLLGSHNGHWFDKLRREWQMHRAFQTTITLHRPDIFIFLGDLFDEGKWCSQAEFKDTVRRFHRLFAVPEGTEVLAAVGNHDVGFHYSMHPLLVERFREEFGVRGVEVVQREGVTLVTINSMAMEGDGCSLCSQAQHQLRVISRQLKCAAGDQQSCRFWHNPELRQYSRPIILQHYPMYRASDAECSEPDEAPPEIKHSKFRQRWECLSQEATDMVMEGLSPRLVLSGHTHHGCHVLHHRKDRPSVPEYTVPSFSWRNKPNPSFSMLTVTANNYSVSKCLMPKEMTVVSLYVVSLLLSLVVWCLSRVRSSAHLHHSQASDHQD